MHGARALTHYHSSNMLDPRGPPPPSFQPPVPGTSPSPPIALSFPQPPDLPVPPDQSPKNVLLSWCQQFLHNVQDMPAFELEQCSEGFKASVTLPYLNSTIISTRLPSPTIQVAENQAAVRAMEHMWKLYKSRRNEQQQQQQLAQ